MAIITSWRPYTVTTPGEDKNYILETNPSQADIEAVKEMLIRKGLTIAAFSNVAHHGIRGMYILGRKNPGQELVWYLYSPIKLDRPTM